MFARIMTPVDLAHAGKLAKALEAAAALAKTCDAEIAFVGVATPEPSRVAHNPAEYGEKLRAFAEAQGASHGVRTSAETVIAHDPAVDLGETLVKEIAATGADLVVMASHVPGVAEHVFASNAGYVASHAPVSVMVIR